MCDVAFCDGLSIDGGNTEGVVHGIVSQFLDNVSISQIYCGFGVY